MYCFLLPFLSHLLLELRQKFQFRLLCSNSDLQIKVAFELQILPKKGGTFFSHFQNTFGEEKRPKLLVMNKFWQQQANLLLENLFSLSKLLVGMDGIVTMKCYLSKGKR